MTIFFTGTQWPRNGQTSPRGPLAADGGRERREVVVPAADVVETEDAFFVTLDMPGLRPDSIDVRLDEGVLQIAAERPRPPQTAGRVLTAERLHGWFERAFRLPDTVDGGKIEARYEGGSLSLTLPKRPQAKPRSIEIKSAN